MVKDLKLFLKSRRMPLSPPYSTQLLGVLAAEFSKERKIKGIQIGKEEDLFADMILHIKIQDSTKKLLELINEFSKVSGYKVSTQNTVVFVYMNN